MNKTFVLLDGKGNTKGIDYDLWGGFEAFLRDTSNGSGGMQQWALLKRVQPWLAKGVSMTANAVADLPFEIYKGKKVIDSSEDWQNKLGGIPNPKKLIRQLAASLCSGRAYVIPTVTKSMIVDLRYVATHTVSYVITSQGLQWFTRASDFGQAGVYYPFDKEELKPTIDPKLVANLSDGAIKPKDINFSDYQGGMMYFWLPDSDIEIGPAKTHPLGTALIAAEILTSSDLTLKTYGERGFVPPTILAAKGMPGKTDRETAERWWNSFLRRATDTVAKIINADSMDVKQVGAGFKELQGAYQEIMGQQIESIGAAFGIPAAVFMSDKAFASEIDQLTRVWYSTSEFKSIYQTIEETLTDQLFARFGCSMKFRPETIDAFQEDETQRASSFKVYVDSGIKHSIAAQMVGLELPEGVEYEQLDKDADANQPKDAQGNPIAGNVPSNDGKKPSQADPAQEAAAQAEAKAFRKFAKQRVKENKAHLVHEFEFKYMPEAEQKKLLDEFGASSEVLMLVEAINKAANG